METWLEVVEVKDGKVRFKAYNVFTETGEKLVSSSTLRFRTEQEIRTSLEQVGFHVKEVYGDWREEPFTSESSMMVFVVQRT